MDELELLKKDWQKKGEDLPKLSFDEIYRMLWKRSSSIVKWIFYISIIELLFWLVMNIFPFVYKPFDEQFKKTYGSDEETLIIGIAVVSTIIVLIFTYYLFRSYKSISTVDNVKNLMENILRTRKIVRYYVVYNLIIGVLITLYTIYSLCTHDEKTIKMLGTLRENGSEFRFWFFTGLMVLVGIAGMVAFIWLFYRLIYGILLKRLQKNYKELKRLEV